MKFESVRKGTLIPSGIVTRPSDFFVHHVQSACSNFRVNLEFRAYLGR